MEVFKLILTNYGPVVASVVLMVYLCFFVKKSVNGNEQKLKDNIVNLLRENAELKATLKNVIKEEKETRKKLENKVDELEEQLDGLIKESEENEPNNEEPKD